MYKESFKNLNDVLLKNNKKDNKKIESMKRIIHKVVAKEASDNWRKHIPVYGWTTMNYPSTIQPSLVQKYKKKQRLKNLENEDNTIGVVINSVVEDIKLPTVKIIYNSEDEDEEYKHPDRLFPQKANEHVMNESKYSLNFNKFSRKFNTYRPY